ncbi:FadR/GntR family transcriptional regulator [Radicibacter daui]|uniref:FadR/GntR family transcriptional regulator n=1 Tax=Radicibacter daui TaxID=3064829 RepID=UPI004046E737
MNAPASTKGKARLADGVVEAIRAEVTQGVLAPGSQLPTEPVLMERFGVSRTVIREAFAELRAAGLVYPAQGKGVFVAERLPPASSMLSADEKRSIPRTIEMLEFRCGIEVEAAGLAAARRSSAQDYEISEKNFEMRQVALAARGTAEADFEFHMAIARASNNAFFVDALSRFGPSAIPRSTLPSLTEVQSADYLQTILAEHGAIADAISRQDVEAARSAMRTHLENSQKRYRAVALAVHAGPMVASAAAPE